MTRLAGYVFDTYDDEDGQVLRSIVENPNHLPPFVKTASRLTEAQIDALSDDQFALVLLADTVAGPVKLKKYATVDKGNTALSVLYFLKQAHLMPQEVATTGARNLIAALDMYSMPIPDDLAKLANKKGSPFVSGKSQKPYLPNAKVHHLQYPEILEEPKESHESPQLGRHDAAWDDVSQRTNAEGTPGSNVMELPAFPQKEKYKTASAEDVARWDQARKGQAALDHTQLFTQTPQTRQQSWRESPYFDVSGWDPSMPGVPDASLPERTLLDGSYPIDGYDQVKTASVYFNDNWKSLGFRDRHTYCVKLAARMSELGMEVPESIARYGSTTYAADVDSYVEARRSYVHEEAYPALDMLLEKRAQVSPGVFANALEEFDRLNDLNWHWDSKIADPWYSTFGPSLQKIADENWRWDGVGTRICEGDLIELAKNDYDRLVNNFGADFAKEFAKSPKAVFMSLPDPNKIILARLASDRFAGTSE